jgi:hypothetical protein
MWVSTTWQNFNSIGRTVLEISTFEKISEVKLRSHFDRKYLGNQTTPSHSACAESCESRPVSRRVSSPAQRSKPDSNRPTGSGDTTFRSRRPVTAVRGNNGTLVDIPRRRRRRPDDVAVDGKAFREIVHFQVPEFRRIRRRR